MVRSAVQQCFLLGARIANIGVTNRLNFHEKTKTQVINIVVASGLPINLFFGIHNFIQHKPVLGALNLLMLLGGFIILYINSRQQFLLGRLILTFLACLLFTTQAILFRNGGEYYLLTNLIIIILYFHEKKYLVSICLASCLLFIGVKVFLNTEYTYDSVSFGRVLFNICWALAIMTMALLFFKTEQLSYQKQIEEKNMALQKLNDTKQKLFSIIAHDLRSPIGQLKNALDLVGKDYLSPDKFQKISITLSSEVVQLHSTLDNLLRWSISQLQGIKANPEKVALTPVLQKKLSLFKQKTEEKNIVIDLEGSGLHVLADPDHLLLVLRNLISNAIKYSYPNSTILIRNYSKDNKVIIEVNDKGIGMTDDIRQSIFASQNIISNTGTANEKGTGLGLKLCKEFIEKNDGHIWVESIEKMGTSFYISLPRAI